MNPIGAFKRWVRKSPAEAMIPDEIRDASHKLRNAATVNQSRNFYARRDLDIMKEWIRDMRRQNVSS